MIIIGCDFHTRHQQIAMANDETGELLLKRRLDHQSGEAHEFYRQLQGPVRVGIESTGPIHWFGRSLAELGHELWIGDAGWPTEKRGQRFWVPHPLAFGFSKDAGLEATSCHTWPRSPAVSSTHLKTAPLPSPATPTTISATATSLDKQSMRAGRAR